MDTQVKPLLGDTEFLIPLSRGVLSQAQGSTSSDSSSPPGFTSGAQLKSEHPWAFTPSGQLKWPELRGPETERTIGRRQTDPAGKGFPLGPERTRGHPRLSKAGKGCSWGVASNPGRQQGRSRKPSASGKDLMQDPLSPLGQPVARPRQLLCQVLLKDRLDCSCSRRLQPQGLLGCSCFERPHQLCKRWLHSPLIFMQESPGMLPSHPVARPFCLS